MVGGARSIRLVAAGALCLVTLLGHGQPAIAKGFLQPQLLAVDEAIGRVFAPGHAHDVAEIDARSGRVLRTIALGWTPQTLCLDAQAHRLYAAGNPASGAGQGRLGVIDTGSGLLLRTVAVGRDPISIAVDSRAKRAFVVGYGDPELGSIGSVTMVDTGRDVALATLHVADFPRQVVADARTGHVFVSDTYSVYMLDAASGRTLRTLSMIGNEPGAMAVDARTHRVFATNGGQVRVIDTRSGSVVASPTLVPDSTVSDFAVDERRGWVVATSYRNADLAGTVSVLDARDGRVLRRTAIGVRPVAVAVLPALDRIVTLDNWYGISDPVQGAVNMHILQETTGRILGGCQLAGMGLAVSARAGRIFVIDQVDSPVTVLDGRTWD